MQFRLTRPRMLQIALASVAFLAPLLLALAVPRAAVDDAWHAIGMDGNKVVAVYALLNRGDSESHTFAVGRGLGVWEREARSGHWRGLNEGLPKGAWGQVPTVLLAASDRDRLRLYLGLGDSPDAVAFYRLDYPGTWILTRSDFEREVIRAVACGPYSPAVYVATARRLYRSADKGLTWEARSTPPGLGAPTVLEIHPRNPNQLWLGTSIGEVYISDDQGETWSQAYRLPLERWVHAIALDPVEPKVAYMAAGASVYVTEDAGESWRPRSAGLGTGFTMALLVDPAARGSVFVGSNPDGVYHSADYGRTWEPFKEGMGRLGVNSLALDPADNETLLAGTDDGVWERSLAWMRSGAGVETPLPFTATPTHSATPQPAAFSATPTRTATRTPTATATATATSTPTATRTAVLPLLATPSPSAEATETATLPAGPTQPPATPTEVPTITPTRPPR